MLDFKKEGKYNIVATKCQGDNFSVIVAFKGKFPPNDLFLLNKFKHKENNNEIFKTLFMHFLSKNKSESFCDFFSWNENFYAVFKYKEEQNLNYKYNKNVCVTDFRTRVKIFEDICIKIKASLVNNYPFQIILSMLETSNITVSDQNDIFINLDLRLIYDYEEKREEYESDKNKFVIKSISNIFGSIFNTEISSKYNKIMNLIYQKCKLGLYKSIEELVSELKNNIEEAEVSSLLEYIKYQINIRKHLIPKLTKIVFIPGLVAACAFLIYKKLSGMDKGYNVQSLTIGDITYSGDGNDKSSKSISIDENLKSNPKVDLTLNSTLSISPDTNIDFDDYIVQSGETPNSISDLYYSDKSYGSIITSFNDIKGNLIPGTLIRIPKKSAVQSYFSDNKSNND